MVIWLILILINYDAMFEDRGLILKSEKLSEE